MPDLTYLMAALYMLLLVAATLYKLGLASVTVDTMKPRHDSGCIYCGSQGPFSDEHVVCAGVGGDDKAWLLTDCVCRVCNTDIFSKLETKFLRSSPAAVARLFLQPRTRKQGNKTGVPSVQANLSFVPDPGSGILLEGLLEAGGQTKVLPQLLVVDAAQAATTGPDADSLTTFLSELRAAISGDLTLIEKKRDGLEVGYEATSLAWKDNSYTATLTETTTKPPHAGIWIEPLAVPATAREGGKLLPRIFRVPAGQLVCRVKNVDQAALFLTTLRQAPELTDSGKIDMTTMTRGNPGIHQRYQFDIVAYDRVLTKIGLNLVAKLLGEAFVRNAAFDSAVAYARDGVGAVYKYPPEHMVEFLKAFGPPLPERHVFALTADPGLNGKHGLAFVARLYGGPIERIRLAEFDTPIPGLEHPILIHVDYVNHKIERLTLEDHAGRVDAAGV
jgi:hypothetical protein